MGTPRYGLLNQKGLKLVLVVFPHEIVQRLTYVTGEGYGAKTTIEGLARQQLVVIISREAPMSTSKLLAVMLLR